MLPEWLSYRRRLIASAVLNPYSSDMREPNFSESQLQQATNTAFIRRIFERYRVWAFAHVPSLIAEFDLGWDTGFYLPWFSHAPLDSDEGCNFFLQYKLSCALTSPGAKEWSHWGEEYFRFKIPHSTRDTAGKFIDDYHQWSCLKILADKGYPTFYATNSTLQKAQLQKTLTDGTLLDQVPLLDVRGVSSLHKHVTFAADATHFILHSEKEETGKGSFSERLDQLVQSRWTNLAESNKEIYAALHEMGGGGDESWSADLERITTQKVRLASENFETFFERLLLNAFVRRHIGADLIWLPKVA